eukprot:m51a1_g907 hypothetical protein (610) ;mRNA; r:105444-108264
MADYDTDESDALAAAAAAGASDASEASEAEQSESEGEGEGEAMSDAAYQFEDAAAESAAARDYDVRSADQLRAFCGARVAEVSETLGLTPDQSLVLLTAFKWRKEALLEAWFTDQAAVATENGISLADPGIVPDPLYCPVCDETVSGAQGYAVPGCGHAYCISCWSLYVAEKFKGGVECTRATCMYPKCKSPCPSELFRRLLSPADCTTYERFFTESLVDALPSCKWCPSPGCQNCVQVPQGYNKPVTCRCGFTFCFECCDYDVGDHAPCDCDMLREWNRKASDESENVTWMRANTKSCPRCHSHIEKNGGCMHMTCRKCRHEFCWLCRADWRTHTACNKSDAVVKEEVAAEDAKTELERYMFYFHRFESHHNSLKIAAEQKQKAHERGAELIQKWHLQSEDVEFLVGAVNTLMRNRNVLQYSYVFAFYFKSKGCRLTLQEKNLFEFLQKDLEMHTDRLSEAYELEDPATFADFAQWKELVLNLTRVSAKFFRHFVEGVIDKSLTTPAESSASYEAPAAKRSRQSEAPAAPRCSPPPAAPAAPAAAPARPDSRVTRPLRPQRSVGEMRAAYVVQLSTLAAMGFTDDTLLIPMLEANGGSVDAVVAVLMD